VSYVHFWYSGESTSAQTDGTSGDAKPSIENQNTEEELDKGQSDAAGEQLGPHSGVGHVRIAYSLLVLVATVATLVG
jgi:hypothetical protein